MAARRARLDHRRPDDDREVGDVDVAAGGEEREVKARHEQPGGDRADERREGGLGERVDGGHEREEREHGGGDHDAVGAVAQRRQQRAEGDRQRVLGRRPVGGERQRVEADELASPQQRVVGVVVRIRRVDEVADERDERERAQPDSLQDGGRRARAGDRAPPRGSRRAVVPRRRPGWWCWARMARRWPLALQADPPYEVDHPDPLLQRGADLAACACGPSATR